MSNKQVTVGDFRQSVAENEECREIKLVSGNRKFSMSPEVFINIAAQLGQQVSMKGNSTIIFSSSQSNKTKIFQNVHTLL